MLVVATKQFTCAAFLVAPIPPDSVSTDVARGIACVKADRCVAGAVHGGWEAVQGFVYARSSASHVTL